MSDIMDRYRRVADAFEQRVDAVPDDAWDNPAPCEGWVARDVVRHLTEWVPAFVSGTWGLTVAPGPSVDDDPVGAWRHLDRLVQGWLSDPGLAASERDTPMGRSSLAQALDMICTGDVLIHTWDLARATGLDETLDPAEVHAYVEAVEPMEEAMRSSGHFGPRVSVPSDADEQTRLIALLGRQP